MKIWRNIQSYLGYLAYKNIAMFVVICLICGTLLIGISTSSMYSLFSFNLFLLLLGITFYFSLLEGINNISTKNYRIAIFKAARTQDDLNVLDRPEIWISAKIDSKISSLIMETRQTKNPTKLNEFIKKIQKIDQLKKTQKEKRESLKNLPDEINKLDTEVYLLENSLLP